MFTNSLKAIDILGYKPKLYLNSENSYKSPLGGFFCLIWFCSIIFSFVFFGKEIYEKQRPITNMSSELNENPSLVKYYKDFQLMVGIPNATNRNKFFYDETIYTISPFLNRFNTTKTPLKMVPCNLDKLHPEGIFLVSITTKVQCV